MCLWYKIQIIATNEWGRRLTRRPHTPICIVPWPMPPRFPPALDSWCCPCPWPDIRDTDSVQDSTRLLCLTLTELLWQHAKWSVVLSVMYSVCMCCCYPQVYCFTRSCRERHSDVVLSRLTWRVHVPQSDHSERNYTKTIMFLDDITENDFTYVWLMLLFHSLSVYFSVCHVRALCSNGRIYWHEFFCIRQPHAL